MTNSDTSETVYNPNVDLHSFHPSATIVFYCSQSEGKDKSYT